MGFNKKYIPDLDTLKDIRERMDDDANFLRIYLYNPDALIGSSESINYLKELANNEKYEEHKK